jgi:hypothetical protein
MAFDPNGLKRQFSKGATASGAPNSHWTYETTDAAATVEGANYFAAAVLDLPKGDTIQATMAKGGTPVGKQYVVTANNGATPTIAIFTATAG